MALKVDRILGTPVLDIKPYIPAYDSPLNTKNCGSSAVIEHREHTTSTDREEPDGEENFGVTTNQLPTASSSAVKVPNWIGNPSKLNVIFTDRASDQLSELELNKV